MLVDGFPEPPGLETIMVSQMDPPFPSGFIVHIMCASVTDTSVSMHHRGVWSPSQWPSRVLCLSVSVSRLLPASFSEAFSPVQVWWCTGELLFTVQLFLGSLVKWGVTCVWVFWCLVNVIFLEDFSHGSPPLGFSPGWTLSWEISWDFLLHGFSLSTQARDFSILWVLWCLRNWNWVLMCSLLSGNIIPEYNCPQSLCRKDFSSPLNFKGFFIP